MRSRPALWVAGLWLLAAGPALPHHAETLYDMKTPTTVKGVVSRVEWSNPHAYLTLNVTNDKGGSEEWSIELNSPNSLKRYGWTSTTVKPGDQITCTGGRAKTGAKTMRGLTVELEDGKRLKS